MARVARHRDVPGLDLELIGEDGNALPTSVQRSAVLLPAGQTYDTLAVTPVDRTYVLFDRMLDLTNADAPNGGMIARVQLGAGSTPPTPTDPLAYDDVYTLNEDGSLVQGAPGVLGNDDPGLVSPTVVTPPTNGTLTLNANGSFTYTPAADYVGSDSFVYKANALPS